MCPREMPAPTQNANDDGKPNFDTPYRNRLLLRRLWATFDEEEPIGWGLLCYRRLPISTGWPVAYRLGPFVLDLRV